MQQLLAQLLHDSMISTNFTTDGWTAHHRPYIGVTIHWISANFELHQALLTIEEISYPHILVGILQKNLLKHLINGDLIIKFETELVRNHVRSSSRCQSVNTN